MAKTKSELLISQEEIWNKISQIAKVIDHEYAGKELVLVLVMKGALLFVADLIRKIQIPCSIEFIQGSSYKNTERGELKLFGIDSLDVTDKEVLIVDDIFDSGVTITEIVKRFQKKHPKSLKTLVLLTKKVKRHTDFVPDYSLFEIENQFVVGYGLDYNEYYRGLPGIYSFKV